MGCVTQIAVHFTDQLYNLLPVSCLSLSHQSTKSSSSAASDAHTNHIQLDVPNSSPHPAQPPPISSDQPENTQDNLTTNIDDVAVSQGDTTIIVEDFDDEKYPKNTISGQMDPGTSRISGSGSDDVKITFDKTLEKLNESDQDVTESGDTRVVISGSAVEGAGEKRDVSGVISITSDMEDEGAGEEPEPCDLPMHREIATPIAEKTTPDEVLPASPEITTPTEPAGRDFDERSGAHTKPNSLDSEKTTPSQPTSPNCETKPSSGLIVVNVDSPEFEPDAPLVTNIDEIEDKPQVSDRIVIEVNGAVCPLSV